MTETDAWGYWDKQIIFAAFYVAISAMLAWLTFARLSIARIAKKMNAAGLHPLDWGPNGNRVPEYAREILKTKKGFTPPAQLRSPVLRFATPKDWYLALWLLVSLYGSMALVPLALLLC